MKLFLKLAAVLFTFILLSLPFAAPKPADAQTGCQLIVSTTSVIAHGSFNATVQNGQPGMEYIINYDAALFHTTFIMPPSGSNTVTLNLDQIFGASSPQASSGSFLVTAGTTLALGLPGAEACSPTSGITINVIAPPIPTVSITAASTNIPYNTATTLNWSSTNTVSGDCTINGSQTINGTSVGTTGTASTGNLTTTTTFTLSCTNVTGTATASVTVTVQAPPPPTATITAASTNIAYNTATNLTWSSTNATSCTINGSSTINGTAVGTAGTGSTGNLTTTTTYALSCTGPGGNAQGSVTVTVQAPLPPQITNFTANPASVIYNNSSTLSWTTTNAASCTINSSSVPVSGSQSTGNLTTTTVFTLNCKGPGGATQQSVTVTVTGQPCSYSFTPATITSAGTVTVTILTGSSTDKFQASITPGSITGNTGPGTPPMPINLTAPTVSTPTNFIVAAVDLTSGNLCALTGPTNTITVNPPAAAWHLDPPNVANNQLSVLFSFTPASNGNIGLIVDKDCTFSSAQRPFDSGAIPSGNTQVTWNFPQPGTYCAELVFGTSAVSNTQTFTVGTPPGNFWTLSNLNCSDYHAFFRISPAAGGQSVLHINETSQEIPITQGSNAVDWQAPSTPATYTAEIIYWGTKVSNQVTITLPCTPSATQWTMFLASVINGNDVLFNVQCPTNDCPGINGEATVAIKDLGGLSQPVPKGGGIVRFNGLPNGTHQAVVVVFLSEESGVVDFTLPQKNNCGWLSFPGGAGFVQGPVNNCSLASPGGIISAILPYIFGIAGFLSIIIIVISGIQFITSSGNPEAAASARNRLVFALIGLAIIILAFAILQIVDKLFLGGSGVS